MAITQLAGLRCIFDEDFLGTVLDNLLLSRPFLRPIFSKDSPDFSLLSFESCVVEMFERSSLFFHFFW